MKFNLRACRKQARFTIMEAAKEIGVSVSTLCEWEKGKTSPEMVEALQISLAYKIPLEYIDFTKSGNI